MHSNGDLSSRADLMNRTLDEVAGDVIDGVIRFDP
jgi:hypothetical protein